MRKLIVHRSRQFSAASLVFVAVLLTLFAWVRPSRSASPTSGSIGPATATPVTWVGTGRGGQGDVSGTVSGEQTCVEGVNCDSFTLTLTGTVADWAGKKARVAITWATNAHDYDMFIHKGTVTGPTVSSSATGGTRTEVADIDPSKPGVGTGAFVVHVVYFSVPPVPTPIDQYSGSASVVPVDAIIGEPPVPLGTARMHNFPAPPGYEESAGEPSIGCNWLTENAPRNPPVPYANSNGTIPNGGTVTYYGGFLAQMLRITFGDCSSPAHALWERKQLITAATPRALGDPILFTDHGYPGQVGPGRTFVSQEESQVGSTTDITDNDGDTFIPSEGAGPPAGVDHQTVAAGPYKGAAPPNAIYPTNGPKRAVYFASQSVSDARTSRSDDGGLTFGPAVPMYTTQDCGGLHGHLKVAPDGTVYVPNNACGGSVDPIGHSDGQQAAIVSEDNGITWSIRKVPGSTTKSDRDPSIGIATDGTIYIGMQSQDGHPRISVSHDKGLNWSAPYDVGASLGIQNCVFPAVVAGDGDERGPNTGRAAFTFFGTTTGGNDYDQPYFTGVWYLYMAVTYDSGQTWTTFNVTPDDPIQRGGICGGGTCRNLLDFFDATIDKEGRILIGYEDGCVGTCVAGGNNSFSARAAIARQGGGKRMFAQHDPPLEAAPEAPQVKGVFEDGQVTLQWPTPDNGGSPITEYRVYRGIAPGTETFLGTASLKGIYVDRTVAPNTTYYYRVTAVNAIGEGPYCGEIVPVAIIRDNPCLVPGVTVLTDPTGDSVVNTGTSPMHDIQRVSVAEPYYNGANKLVFTIKVATLDPAPPPDTTYPLYFTGPDGKGYYVGMRTAAPATPATPRFEYGTATLTTPTYSTTYVGNADPESNYQPNGTITIVVPNNKFGLPPNGPAAGQILKEFYLRVRLEPGVTPDNCPDSLAPGGIYTLVGNAFCAPKITPVSVVSNKVHGNSGPFGINLPLTGSPGVECRSGGSAGNYRIDLQFPARVTFGNASVTSGTGSVTSTTGGGNSGNSVTIELSGVTTQQILNVTLPGVSDGTLTNDIVIPMGVLVGDANADGTVNSGDAMVSRNHSGEVTDGNNFRSDVNFDGAVNSGDAFIVRSKSGNTINPP